MKKYQVSFWVGLGSVLFLIFGPLLLYEIIPALDRIPDVATDISRNVREFLGIKVNRTEFISLLISYLFLSLPFFILYPLGLLYSPRSGSKPRSFSFLFFSFLFFLSGVIIGYILFIALALFGTTQWTGPF